MRRPTRKATRSAVALLAFSLTSACGSGPREAGGWTRHDLGKNPPPGDARFVLEPRILGDGVLRPERAPQARSKRLAGEAMAIVAPAGEELVWPLDLGDEPFLSYVPLSQSQPGCRLDYRVRIREGGAWTDVSTHSARSDHRSGPATVEVGLDAWAGRRVDLGLTVFAGGPRCKSPEAVWASAGVFDRRPAGAPQGSASRPNVVLVGVDTLRADALGVYGRRPSPSPAIDRLAAESDVFLDAFATFNTTNPSFASIMTGLYGKDHGVYDLLTPLGEEHHTLAESFRDAGYVTTAILSVRHLAHRQSGLGQGFDNVQVPHGQYAAQYAVDEAIDWLTAEESPFFLWLHLFDPHTPHTPPEPFASGFHAETPGLVPGRRFLTHRLPGSLRTSHRLLGAHELLYYDEVAYLDHQVGRLLDFLESRDLDRTTIVVLVGDHGENLGEHGVDFRHTGLFDTTVKVPLLIRWPGRERPGRRIEGLVQTLDLFPTLTAAAGLETPDQDGHDLARFDGGRRVVFAEANRKGGAMVRTSEHLYFRADHDQGPIGKGVYLFDLVDDPAQAVNLAGRGLAVEERLRLVLDAWLAERRRGEAPVPVSLSPDEIDELRALGYLDP